MNNKFFHCELFNGRNIKVTRLYNAMTLRDLSNETNININLLSKYELNKRIPKKEEILRLANILRVFPEHFFQTPAIDINKLSYYSTTYFCNIHN